MAQKQNNLFQLILLRSSVSIAVYFHYWGKFKTNWMHGYLIFYVKYCTSNVVSRLQLAGVRIEYKAVSNSNLYLLFQLLVIILEKSFTCFLESSYSSINLFQHTFLGDKTSPFWSTSERFVWISYSSIISTNLFRRQNFAILKYKRQMFCLNCQIWNVANC